jgi:hypothetical protein
VGIRSRCACPALRLAGAVAVRRSVAAGCEDAQYTLLLAILRSGELLTPNGPGDSRSFDTPLFSETGEERYRQSVICFCDIPEADLTIHMTKYGRFGLAFTKEFLTQRGARPVYYVATTTTGVGASNPGAVRP